MQKTIGTYQVMYISASGLRLLQRVLETVDKCHLHGVVADQLLSISPFVAMGH